MDRYQDYVIKDGKLVGKFEEMYQKFEDPWKQKLVNDSYVRHATSLSITKYGISSIAEIGCGLGFTTNYLKSLNPEVYIEGIDISETAVQKARENFPELPFYVGSALELSSRAMKYDALLFAEVMWYVLDDLKKIFNNIERSFGDRGGGYVLINQFFYPEGVQQYGRNYFTNVDQMIDFFPWKCIEKIVEYRVEGMDTHTVFKIK